MVDKLDISMFELNRYFRKPTILDYILQPLYIQLIAQVVIHFGKVDKSIADKSQNSFTLQ